MTSLNFDLEIAKNYTSNSQKIRVLSEDWVTRNLFCPSCGSKGLKPYPNNSPVADIGCIKCQSDYELKSQRGTLAARIVDGAYHSMIERITSRQNPNFLFLGYSSSYTVCHLLAIPAMFITPEIIQKRKPLGLHARRAGWIGCNILYGRLPDAAKIAIIRNGILMDQKEIVAKWQKTTFFNNIKIERRNWIFEIMKCIEAIDADVFNLSEVYKFESLLQKKYPSNKNIRAKIRQQLQVLRDNGYLEFRGGGNYKIFR